MVLRTLVVGCGHMGTSHARAYHAMDDFEIVGLVSRGAASRRRLNAELGGRFPSSAIIPMPSPSRSRTRCASAPTPRRTRSTRSPRSRPARTCFSKSPSPTPSPMRTRDRRPRGAPSARSSSATSSRCIRRGRQFTEIARTLGTPLVMRMNLNQQSSGADLGRRIRSCCAARRRSSIAACTTWTSCAG